MGSMKGMRLLLAAGAVAIAGSVAQAGVVAAWSGSGTSGTDPFGHTWLLNTQGDGSGAWGIPGLGEGTQDWNSQTPVTDFHITFFGLPQGVTIDENPTPSGPGGFDESTRFSNLADFVLWTRSISGNTVTFTAPDASAALNFGESFFVNIAFTGAVSSRDFSFEAVWTDDVLSVPLPSSALMGLGLLGGLAGFAWRKRRAQAIETL